MMNALDLKNWHGSIESMKENKIGDGTWGLAGVVEVVDRLAQVRLALKGE